MRIREGEENIKNFVYKTSVNQLNEQLDATISERIRILARSKTHLQAYSIKGKEHTDEMIRYMNGIFETKGIEIRSVIITNVVLDAEIARQLEEKTTYASKNTLERKQQCFELRVINDEQEYNQKMEKMAQERETENERFRKIKADVEKELDKIQADSAKIIAEIKESAKAHVAKVIAQGELDAQEIQGSTKLIGASIAADGNAKTNKIIAESEAYVLKKNAEARQKAAEKVADELKVKGKSEAILAKNLQNRRGYEEQMAKLGILQDLALNNNMTVFGDYKDNMVAQLASLKLLS